ncbi:MAG: prephenate dehydrogenase [Marivirga sp.]|jgi:prephenate dehydrogenase
MIVSIIGVGLIGGSIALELKKANYATKIIGVDRNQTHLQQAYDIGIIDEDLSLEDALKVANIIILAIPVDSATKISTYLLDHCQEDAVVFDVGSLKLPLCKAIEKHPKRHQFVAVHPIAGTEFSGPQAAHLDLFRSKINIICDAHKSNEKGLDSVQKIFQLMGAKTIMMKAETHDKHITYVSHLSHITSFALSLTVQALEKTNQNIYNMAGSGFSSTVRLAQSTAQMWVPIFSQNKENILPAIEVYINELTALKKMIENDDTTQLINKINNANKIKKILP